MTSNTLHAKTYPTWNNNILTYWHIDILTYRHIDILTYWHTDIIPNWPRKHLWRPVHYMPKCRQNLIRYINPGLYTGTGQLWMNCCLKYLYRFEIYLHYIDYIDYICNLYIYALWIYYCLKLHLHWFCFYQSTLHY